MKVIVSDTSILSNFIHIDCVHVLPALYEQIIIPPAVWAELLQLEKRNTDLSDIKTASWLRMEAPRDNTKLALLRVKLDPGEAQAIILALELSADFLLMDELLGRKEAKKQNLPVIGSLGILLLAKEKSLIAEIKPLMDVLKLKGFWISEKLYDQVLGIAGEV